MVYNYSNIQTKKIGNSKIIHKISIKNNKGTKCISHYLKNKHIKTYKKPLSNKHIKHIKNKKFIKGLFNDCK